MMELKIILMELKTKKILMELKMRMQTLLSLPTAYYQCNLDGWKHRKKISLCFCSGLNFKS